MKENLREQLRENLLSGSTWLRVFFMLVYGIVCYFAIIVAILVILFQFGVMLLSGKLNEHLLTLGQSLSLYIHQLFNYLTYISDEKPFPIGSWPVVNNSEDEYDTSPVVSFPKESEPPQKNE